MQTTLTTEAELAKLRAVFTAAKALHAARSRWDSAMDFGTPDDVHEADDVEIAAMRELLNAVEEAES